VGSRLGLSEEKILALADYATSPLYSEAERVTLEYADSMTITGREVSDELFAHLRQFYTDDELVELTEIIAWENASSKFNRALRIPSQQLWKRKDSARGAEEGEQRGKARAVSQEQERLSMSSLFGTNFGSREKLKRQGENNDFNMA
jgi:hypothetical protein